MPDNALISYYSYKNYLLYMHTGSFFAPEQNWEAETADFSYAKGYCYHFPATNTDSSNIYNYDSLSSAGHVIYRGLPQAHDFIYYACLPNYSIFQEEQFRDVFIYKRNLVPVPAFLSLEGNSIGGRVANFVAPCYDSEFQPIIPTITVYAYDTLNGYNQDLNRQKHIIYENEILSYDNLLPLGNDYTYFLIAVTYNGYTSYVGLHSVDNKWRILQLNKLVSAHTTTVPYLGKDFTTSNPIAVPLFINFSEIENQTASTLANLYVTADPHGSVEVTYIDEHQERQTVTVSGTSTPTQLTTLVNTAYTWTASTDVYATVSPSMGGGIIDTTSVSIRPTFTQIGGQLIVIRQSPATSSNVNLSLTYTPASSDIEITVHPNNDTNSYNVSLTHPGYRLDYQARPGNGYEVTIQGEAIGDIVPAGKEIRVGVERVPATIDVRKNTGVEHIYLTYTDRSGELHTRYDASTTEYLTYTNYSYSWEATADGHYYEMNTPTTGGRIIPLGQTPITEIITPTATQIGAPLKVIIDSSVSSGEVDLTLTYVDSATQETVVVDPPVSNTNYPARLNTSYRINASRPTGNGWEALLTRGSTTNRTQISGTVTATGVTLNAAAEHIPVTLKVTKNANIQHIYLTYTHRNGTIYTDLDAITHDYETYTNYNYSWRAVVDGDYYDVSPTSGGELIPISTLPIEKIIQPVASQIGAPLIITRTTSAPSTRIPATLKYYSPDDIVHQHTVSPDNSTNTYAVDLLRQPHYQLTYHSVLGNGYEPNVTGDPAEADIASSGANIQIGAQQVNSVITLTKNEGVQSISLDYIDRNGDAQTTTQAGEYQTHTNRAYSWTATAISGLYEFNASHPGSGSGYTTAAVSVSPTPEQIGAPIRIIRTQEATTSAVGLSLTYTTSSGTTTTVSVTDLDHTYAAAFNSSYTLTPNVTAGNGYEADIDGNTTGNVGRVGVTITVGLKRVPTIIHVTQNTGVQSISLAYTDRSGTTYPLSPVSAGDYLTYTNYYYSWTATAAHFYQMNEPASGNGYTSSNMPSVAPTARQVTAPIVIRRTGAATDTTRVQLRLQYVDAVGDIQQVSPNNSVNTYDAELNSHYTLTATMLKEDGYELTITGDLLDDQVDVDGVTITIGTETVAKTLQVTKPAGVTSLSLTYIGTDHAEHTESITDTTTHNYNTYSNTKYSWQAYYDEHYYQVNPSSASNVLISRNTSTPIQISTQVTAFGAPLQVTIASSATSGEVSLVLTYIDSITEETVTVEPPISNTSYPVKIGGSYQLTASRPVDNGWECLLTKGGTTSRSQVSGTMTAVGMILGVAAEQVPTSIVVTKDVGVGTISLDYWTDQNEHHQLAEVSAGTYATYTNYPYSWEATAATGYRLASTSGNGHTGDTSAQVHPEVSGVPINVARTATGTDKGVALTLTYTPTGSSSPTTITPTLNHDYIAAINTTYTVTAGISTINGYEPTLTSSTGATGRYTLTESVGNGVNIIASAEQVEAIIRVEKKANVNSILLTYTDRGGILHTNDPAQTTDYLTHTNRNYSWSASAVPAYRITPPDHLDATKITPSATTVTVGPTATKIGAQLTITRNNAPSNYISVTLHYVDVTDTSQTAYPDNTTNVYGLKYGSQYDLTVAATSHNGREPTVNGVTEGVIPDAGDSIIIGMRQVETTIAITKPVGVATITLTYYDRNNQQRTVSASNGDSYRTYTNYPYSWTATAVTGYTLRDDSGSGVTSTSNSVAPEVLGVPITFSRGVDSSHVSGLQLTYTPSGSTNQTTITAQFGTTYNAKPGSRYAWSATASTGYSILSDSPSSGDVNSAVDIVVGAQIITRTLSITIGANVSNIKLTYTDSAGASHTNTTISSSQSLSVADSTSYSWTATAASGYTITTGASGSGTIGTSNSITTAATKNAVINVTHGSNTTMKLTYIDRSNVSHTVNNALNDYNTLYGKSYSWQATADSGYHITGTSQGSGTVNSDTISLYAAAEPDIVVTTIYVTLGTGVASVTLSYTNNIGTPTTQTFSQNGSVLASQGTYYSWTASAKTDYRLNSSSGSGYVTANMSISVTAYLIQGVQFKKGTGPTGTRVMIDGDWHTLPYFHETNNTISYTIYQSSGTVESINGTANPGQTVTVGTRTGNMILESIEKSTGPTSTSKYYDYPSSSTTSSPTRSNWVIGTYDPFSISIEAVNGGWYRVLVTLSGPNYRSGTGSVSYENVTYYTVSTS